MPLITKVDRHIFFGFTLIRIELHPETQAGQEMFAPEVGNPLVLGNNGF
jgi:hypothetical protein